MAKYNMLRTKSGLYVAACALGLGGILACNGDNPIEPDMPPTIAESYIGPRSGMAPLPVDARLTCEDDKGIREYKTEKGSETTSNGTTPINTSFTFTGPDSLNLGCTDTGGQTKWYRSYINPTQPPQPTITQTADLVNYVDIKLTLNATNVPEATREHYHNGNLTETRTFTTFPQSETLTDRLIGNWSFIAKAPGVVPDTTVGADVLDYESEAPDLSGVNIDGNERDSTEVHLARATELNTEQRPVKYTGVTATGGVEASIGAFPRDTILKIKWPEIAGPDPVSYSIELTREGSSNIIALEGRVLDVSEPAPDQIAFGGNRINSRDHIFLGDLIDSQLTNIQKLTDYEPVGPGLPDDYHPAWSPDGTQIAFTSFRDGSPAIYIMNADGSNQTRLTGDLRLAWEPDWSPDGSKIAFSYIDSGLAGIGTINTDGSGFTKLHKVSCPSSCSLPSGASWSPDGSKIVFDSNVSGNWEVHVMDADGSNQKNITNHSAIDAMPEWSPDGSKIAFVSLRGNGSLDLHLMNPDGGNVRRLTSDPGAELNPSFSPDGSKILFAHSRNYNPQIYLMNTDGTGEWTQLTTGRPNSAPAWRPRQ